MFTGERVETQNAMGYSLMLAKMNQCSISKDRPDWGQLLRHGGGFDGAWN